MTLKRPTSQEDLLESQPSKSGRFSVESSPFAQFKLTHVSSLGNSFSNSNSVTLRSLLYDENLESMAQFNYMFDIPWMLSHLPETIIQTIKILIVHGTPLPPSHSSNIQLFKPNMPIPYGVHHSKMMILFYKNKTMRVVIHTANMIERDWEDKTQGCYITPYE